MRDHLSSVEPVQKAFEAGRSLPTQEDVISDTTEDAILESLEIAAASIVGLREAVLAIARELDDRAST